MPSPPPNRPRRHERNMISRWPKHIWEGEFNLGGEFASGGQGGNGSNAAAYLAGPLNEHVALRLNATRNHVASVADRDDPRYSEIEGRKGYSGGGTLLLTPTAQQASVPEPSQPAADAADDAVDAPALAVAESF